MTKKYIALRVRQYDKAVAFLEEQGVKIVHSRLETRDQALSNLTEGLFDQGMERVIDQHELRWMLIEGLLNDQQLESWSLCDLSLDVEWFDQYKHDIRHYTGVAYWDATYGLAQTLSWKSQDRELSYCVTPTSVESIVPAPKKQTTKRRSRSKESQSSVTHLKKTKTSKKKTSTTEFQLDLFG